MSIPVTVVRSVLVPLLSIFSVYIHVTYVYIYIHTCIHTYRQTYIQTYIHTCIHKYMYTIKFHHYSHSPSNLGLQLHCPILILGAIFELIPLQKQLMLVPGPTESDGFRELSAVWCSESHQGGTVLFKLRSSHRGNSCPSWVYGSTFSDPYRLGMPSYVCWFLKPIIYSYLL